MNSKIGNPNASVFPLPWNSHNGENCKQVVHTHIQTYKQVESMYG